MLSRMSVWIVVLSFGFYVSGERCTNKTTMACPKTVIEQTNMTRRVSDTCSRTTETCLGWNLWGIRCRDKNIYYRCSKLVTYSSLRSKEEPGCCEGFTEENGCCIKDRCPFDQWGQNCTKNCSCATNNYEKCDMQNGSCFCNPGWFGSRCTKQCLPGTYGDDCKWNCSCEHNATCDHVTGACNCSSVVGWTGVHCNEECPSGYYGTNCSRLCNCAHENQECDRVSGDCRCISGKTGPNCTQDCSTDAFMFGTDCAESCACIQKNSVYCEPTNGSCVCKPGWKGDRCEKSCDPYRYGQDCQENCTCAVTDICDHVNGTCLHAEVCFAEHTGNCMPSYNVSCTHLKENCGNNDTAVKEMSLTQSMLDICCRGGIQKILCISTDKCECRPGYSGHSCNASTRFDNLGEDDDDSTVQLPLILVPVVLVIVVVALVTVFVIRRKKRSLSEHKQHYANNRSYGEARSQTVEGTSSVTPRKLNASDRENPEESEEYNVLQRQGLKSQSGDTDMYSVNKNDVNDYGYDVSVQARNDDENENYSSTVVGETYDHLKRDSVQNNVRKMPNDDTYSHAHQSATGEDEYHVANLSEIPLESDYDHTNDFTDDNCQMYSNTGGIPLQGMKAYDVYA